MIVALLGLLVVPPFEPIILKCEPSSGGDFGGLYEFDCGVYASCSSHEGSHVEVVFVEAIFEPGPFLIVQSAG